MQEARTKPRVAILTATRKRPSKAFLDSLEASVAALDAAGYEHYAGQEVGCPYISGARAKLLRRAMMQIDPDIFVFIDDDMSWRPEDLIKLIQTEGDVVGGTYRFRSDEERYMGVIFVGDKGRPMVRESDGAIMAVKVPAGFLKVTKAAIARFMEAYPELVIEAMDDPSDKMARAFRSVDLFNHGAWKGVWFGEDYAFCRNWLEAGGEIWLPPDLNIDHNDHETGKCFKGNFHEYLLRLPGGERDPKREKEAA